MAEGLAGAYTQSPGPSEAPDLIRRVARYAMVQDFDEGREVALAGIRDAENLLNTRVWAWTLTSGPVTFAAADNTYVLPTTFKAPRHFELLNSDSLPVARLRWYEPKEFESAFRDRTAQGSPVGYTCFNVRDDGTATLSQRPDTAFIATYPSGLIRYYRRVQTLTSTSATPLAIPREVESFVFWRAAGFTADHYMPQRSARAYANADQLWRELIADSHESSATDFDAST